MSASFPPEIWGQVFHFATFEPHSVSPPLGNIHYHYYRHDLGQRRVLQASTTNSIIGRVCQEWRSLVEPLLNEHIVVNSFASLDELIDTMKIFLPGGRTRGEYVRRLDIIAPRKKEDDREMVYRTLSSIEELLSHLPYLRSLLFRNSIHATKGALDHNHHPFFASAASTTLESIVWLDDCPDWMLLRVPAALWAAFLGGHPNLKVVHPPRLGPAMRVGNPINILEKPMMELTDITLRLESTISIQDSFSLPGRDPAGSKLDIYSNLRHVIFRIPILGPMLMEAIGNVVPVPTMFEVHGHKLTSLHCVFPKTLDTASFQLQYFTIIAKYCPNLEELGLFFNWKHPYKLDLIRWTGEDFPCFPTVSILKIQRLNRHFDVRAYSTMLDFVQNLGAKKDVRLPSWEVLGFNSERDVAYLRRYGRFLQEGLEKLAHLQETLGIGLVDSEGKALNFS